MCSRTHSGRIVALGAAPGQDAIRSLVAYSPGFGAEYPDGSLDQIEAAIRQSDPDTALRLVFRDVIGMPPEDIQVLADSEVWQVRVAAAWSVVRECQADEAFLRRERPAAGRDRPAGPGPGRGAQRPGQARAGRRLARMIPGAELDDLAGQGHAAHHTAPAALTTRCLAFFDGVRGQAS